MAIAYYNKKQEPEKAKEKLEKAFALDPTDARVFLELDQLHKKLGDTFGDRLKEYEAHRELMEERDDLYTEYVTIPNLAGRHRGAYEAIMGHRFGAWEGAEGKITTQYKTALLEMAKEAVSRGAYEKAALGAQEPAGMMYYYDQPADMILYQGLAK